MGTLIANIQNALAPVTNQPIAQSRIGRTPIYSGAPGGEDIGSTYQQPFSSNSYITLQPGQSEDLSPIVLKHEIIHSLSNKYGVDPTKLDFQDPPGHTFKSNLDPKEWMSYALAGPGTSPEVQSAMQKAIQTSKSVPQGFKDDLTRLGMLSGGAMPQQTQPTPIAEHDYYGNPVNSSQFMQHPAATGDHDFNGNPIQDSRIIKQPSPPEGQPASFYGKMAAQALPMLGSMIEPGLGTLAGSSIKTVLQGTAPETFGQPAQNLTDFAKSLTIDLLSNEGIPQALGWAGKAVARNLPAVKEGTANLLTKNIQSQLASRSENEIIGDAANQFTPGNSIPARNPKFPNIPPLPTSVSALENNEVGQLLQKYKAEQSLPPDAARTVDAGKLGDKIFSTATNVGNAKLVADPDTIAELGYRKLLGNEGNSINAKGILKTLGDKSDIYQEAFGDKLPAFKDALGEIAKQQETGPAGRLLNYAGHHLIWSGVATGGVGLLTHSALPTAVAGGAVLSNVVFGKLMASPEWAPIVVAALKTAASDAQAPFINQFMDLAIKSVTNASVAASAK